MPIRLEVVTEEEYRRFDLNTATTTGEEKGDRSTNVIDNDPTQTPPTSDPRVIKSPNRTANSDGSIIGIANSLIESAIRRQASDIHVEPYEGRLRIRYRIDGVLQEVEPPRYELMRSLISRLKIMGDLDIAEKRRPQDGRIRFTLGSRSIDIRMSTLPTEFGEKIVLRILDQGHIELDLSKLGFEQSDLGSFRRTLRLPYGMILVTGPTGSGKTTTLYAGLEEINEPSINITTIEDPIEYNLAGINQTHVKRDIGLTFAASLRSILRQDPNVIMVGEIRDTETAEIAIRAALTGHLVLSTLHTNDAPSAITRLVDMGVEPFLVAASVRMILAQRLVRTLCRECATPSTSTQEEARELQLPPTSIVHRALGCDHCGGIGYRGRSAVYEVMKIENGLSEAIAKGASTAELRSMARGGGMRTLREAASVKVLRGESSCSEVMRETLIA